MTSQAAKAIFVLTILALGTLQSVKKHEPIQIKDSACPSMSHLIQKSNASVTEIIPVLSFIGDFYTLLDEGKNFKTPTGKVHFTESFA